MEQQNIGKWFTEKVCGNLIIIKVTGWEQAGERYDSPSYTGEKTIIFRNGISMHDKWACDEKAFHSYLKSGKLKEFTY